MRVFHLYNMHFCQHVHLVCWLATFTVPYHMRDINAKKLLFAPMCVQFVFSSHLEDVSALISRLFDSN